MEQIIDALGLEPGATESEALGAIEGLKQGAAQLEAMSQRVQELEARLGQKEAEELVTQAMRAGKLTPAQRDWALEFAGRDPKGFSAFSQTAPVMVPMGQAAPAPLSTGAHRPEGVQVMVNRALGIQDETFKTYNR